MRNHQAGRRLARIRWERRMSQRRLADLSGVNLRTIERWETEGMPVYLSQLVAVARALGVSVDELTPNDGGGHDG